MALFPLPADYARIRQANGFAELTGARFESGVNAICWARRCAGDFGEVIARLNPGEGITAVDEAHLEALPVTAAGKLAVDVLREDLGRLRELGRDPVLNCIRGYPRDENPGAVATDVYSFHADSAPIEADTWLCTYHGLPSEGLRNDEATRAVDLPDIRPALLREFGGADDESFATYLAEGCYDLHYRAGPGAIPFSFGCYNLWRIAVAWPGASVPPCIHRAPATHPADPVRLLLIA